MNSEAERHAAGRVAVVTDACYPWNVGGKEVRQHELWSRLAAGGTSVEVYTMKWWPEPQRSVVRDGVRFHAICPKLALYAGERRSIVQAAVFAACTTKLLTRRFDVIEADAIPFLHLYPVKVVATLKRVPLVVTWHEFWGAQYWRRYLKGPRGVLAASIERWAARLPDKIIAASSGTAARLIASGRRQDSVTVVANGVDITGTQRRVLSSEADSGPHRPPHPVPDLVFAGRLLSHKNVDLIISALALLAADGVQRSLAVIGRGPELDRLQQLADDLGVADQITFRAPYDEHLAVLQHFAAARALVFPSVREGFGMVALEALACGTPVVTVDHPDNEARHLVQEGRNGALCEPTAESVAAAIERVLADRDELSVGALASAEAYGWGSLAVTYSDLHQQLVGR